MKKPKKEPVVAEVFSFPNKMLVVSDGNIVVLNGVNDKGGIYCYEKSITKKGDVVTLSKEYVLQMVSSKLFIEI